MALLGTRSRLLGGLALGVCAALALLGACSAAGFAGAGTESPGDAGASFSDGSIVVASDGGAPATADSSAEGGVTGIDAGVVPGPIPLLAVHASANLYDFRLCFGVASGGSSSILPVPAYPDDPSHPVPETNYPGVPVGGAAMLPALAIAGTEVTAYVVRAQLLAQFGYLATNVAEPTCDQLICSGGSDCLSEHLDYFPLPPVSVSPSGGGPLILAVEGCGPSILGAASLAQCGAGYTAANGNLSALLGQVASPGSGDGGSWTIQLADLSPSFDADDAGPPALTYVDPATDASVPLPVSPGSIDFVSTALPLSEAGVTSAYFTLGPSLPPALTQSLVSIQYFQAPSSDPFTYFTAPVTYFTAILGDATDAAAPASLLDGAANPAFDGHGLHVLAYPTTAE